MKYLLLAFSLMISTMTFAAGTKTYQVTGPVLEVRDDAIVVQKGNEKWEIARDQDTKGGTDIKAGDKVTVQYTMKAKTISKK